MGAAASDSGTHCHFTRLSDVPGDVESAPYRPYLMSISMLAPYHFVCAILKILA